MSQHNDPTERRKALVRTPNVPATHVTERDLLLLVAIYQYGGVLTTIQIALLFFAPDLLRRLLEWGITRSVAEAWMQKYSQSYLYERVEFLKWALKIAKLRATYERSKVDQKLIDWLAEIHKGDNDAFVELITQIDEAEPISPTQYLCLIVEQNRSLPKAYTLRPRVASEFESSACKQRLRKLLDFGFIEPEQQATKLSNGRAQTCWFLSRQGRNLVAEVQKVTPKELDWKPTGAYGLLHLSHRLLVNDFRIAVEIACQQLGYELRRWIDDNQLKRMLGTEKVTLQRVTHPGEGNPPRTISESHSLKIPDGFFWLDFGNGKQRHCWFELDNQTLTIDHATTNQKSFVHKIRTMSAFYRTGRYKELFPEAGNSMWYLIVTSGSTTRLNNLKSATENLFDPRSKALDRYWFTTMSSIQTWQNFYRQSVFEPIWQRAGQDRLWRLDEETEQIQTTL